jgi:hypothetical protein
MEEIAKTFGDIGLTPKIHLDAADMYRFVGASPLAEETPETRDRDRTLAQVIAGSAAHLQESQAPRRSS